MSWRDVGLCALAAAVALTLGDARLCILAGVLVLVAVGSAVAMRGGRS